MNCNNSFIVMTAYAVSFLSTDFETCVTSRLSYYKGQNIPHSRTSHVVLIIKYC